MEIRQITAATEEQNLEGLQEFFQTFFQLAGKLFRNYTCVIPV